MVSAKPLIVRTIAEYRAWRKALPHTSTVGFVPTMGALHRGHLSLATRASSETSNVVMSIFVNPAQFAPTEDLERYPRTLETDLQHIQRLGCIDVLFLPSAKEIYPSGIVQDVTRQTGAFVSVQGLSHQLEGSIRPTFFRGVATVLTKFLNIIRPDIMYLGQKDVQQSIVVRRMMKDLCYEGELRVGETVREEDGLAMSSRNVYLDPVNRARAPCLYRALSAAREAYETGETNCATLREKVRAVLAQEDGVVVEYVSVADTEALEEMDVVQPGEQVVISAAIVLGKTRILDNIILNRKD